MSANSINTAVASGRVFNPNNNDIFDLGKLIASFASSPDHTILSQLSSTAVAELSLSEKRQCFSCARWKGGKAVGARARDHRERQGEETNYGNDKDTLWLPSTALLLIGAPLYGRLLVLLWQPFLPAKWLLHSQPSCQVYSAAHHQGGSDGDWDGRGDGGIFWGSISHLSRARVPLSLSLPHVSLCHCRATCHCSTSWPFNLIR